MTASFGDATASVGYAGRCLLSWAGGDAIDSRWVARSVPDSKDCLEVLWIALAIVCHDSKGHLGGAMDSRLSRSASVANGWLGGAVDSIVRLGML